MSIKKSDQFKSIYLERMQSFCESMGYKDISHADSVTIGKAFLRFYLIDVFSAFHDIDEDEIEAGIVNGKNDLDIDFIHILENQIYIIQSKYGNSYKGEEDLARLIQIPQNIKVADYVKRAKPDLKEVLDEIIKIKNPIFNLNLITTQRLDPEIIKHYEQNAAPNSNVGILDRTKLWIDYNRAMTLSDEPPIEIKLNFGDEDFLELKI